MKSRVVNGETFRIERPQPCYNTILDRRELVKPLSQPRWQSHPDGRGGDVAVLPCVLLTMAACGPGIRCGVTFTPRAAWAETPEPMRTAVAEALGTPIVGHTDLHGGMSPGPAAGLRLADGRQVFVKAVSAEIRAHNHKMILQEAAILDALPTSVPAPRRVATVEHGPWVALVTTWAAGTTGTSWTDVSIAAVANACRTASEHRAPGTLPPVAQRIFDFNGWTRLLEIGTSDDWEATHAGPAADVVAGWEHWTAGDALVHRDLRLDNTTVDVGKGSAVLLDWAYAAAGAPWIDLAQLAADVVATGHALGQQAAMDRGYRLLRTLPPEASRFVVGLAGMWCIRAATVPDTFNPSISTWRRARSAALRPLVARLIADFRDSTPERTEAGHRCRQGQPRYGSAAPAS